MKLIPSGVTKLPYDITDFTVDWTGALGASVISTIDSVLITDSHDEDADVTSDILDASTLSSDDKVVTLRLKGGEISDVFDVQLKVTWSDGQKRDAKFTLSIVDR